MNIAHVSAGINISPGPVLDVPRSRQARREEPDVPRLHLLDLRPDPPPEDARNAGDHPRQHPAFGSAAAPRRYDDHPVTLDQVAEERLARMRWHQVSYQKEGQTARKVWSTRPSPAPSGGPGA